MSNIENLRDLIIYQSQNNKNIRVEVLYNEEDFWLTQKSMAELFGIEVNTINYHLKEIFKIQELQEESVIRKIRITANDGKKYNTNFYSLDAIIAVGYRVNSKEATEFRIWATKTLKEYIKKGFVVNTKMFEIPAIKSMQYVLWQVVAIGGNVVGFDSSAELLEHSLTDKPKDLLITEGEIVEEIKNDSQFKTRLNEIVKEYGKNKLEFNTENGKKLSLQFDNSDLYFSIHKADIKVIGKKENDKWNLEIELIDTYDYSEFKKIKEYIKDANSVPKSMFSSFIYNLDHISSMFGVIKEYKVIVRFTIDDYEVI